jgi:hypothetical protein
MAYLVKRPARGVQRWGRRSCHFRPGPSSLSSRRRGIASHDFQFGIFRQGYRLRFSVHHCRGEVCPLDKRCRRDCRFRRYLPIHRAGRLTASFFVALGGGPILSINASHQYTEQESSCLFDGRRRRRLQQWHSDSRTRALRCTRVAGQLEPVCL